VINSIKAEVFSSLVWSLQVYVCQGGKTSAMILEKLLFLPSIWEGIYGHFQTIWSPLFYSKEDNSQVENIQDSCQSSLEWTSQQIHPRIMTVKLPKTQELHLRLYRPQLTC